MKVEIEINNCKRDNCPFFIISRVESTDGFDRGEYWHCKKADKPIENFVEWHEEKDVPVPDWCPIQIKS